MSAVVSFTNTGRALKCWAPAHLGGGRNASGDIQIHWTRRARINGQWLMNGAPVPLGEATEKYKILIYTDNTYAVAAAPAYFSTTPTLSLSAAEQTSAFGGALTAGNCFTGVSQLGALGYGYEARAAI